MKEKLLIVLFVVMGLLLASCGSAPQQPVNNNPAPTDVDETPETPVNPENPEEPVNPQENPEDDPFGDVDMVDMGLYMPLITTEAESHYVGYMYDQIKVIKDLNFDVLATEFSVNLIELGGSDPRTVYNFHRTVDDYGYLQALKANHYIETGNQDPIDEATWWNSTQNTVHTLADIFDLDYELFEEYIREARQTIVDESGIFKYYSLGSVAPKIGKLLPFYFSLFGKIGEVHPEFYDSFVGEDVELNFDIEEVKEPMGYEPYVNLMEVVYDHRKDYHDKNFAVEQRIQHELSDMDYVMGWSMRRSPNQDNTRVVLAYNYSSLYADIEADRPMIEEHINEFLKVLPQQDYPADFNTTTINAFFDQLTRPEEVIGTVLYEQNNIKVVLQQDSYIYGIQIAIAYNVNSNGDYIPEQ